MLMTSWPLQSQSDAFYGNPRGRNGQASSSWESANLTLITPPFQMFFLAKPARPRVHKKCADAFMAWFETVWKNAGRDKRVIRDWGMDDYAGAYNFRRMRNGAALSMHAYGCAIDLDADRNGMGDATPHFATLREQVVKPFLDLGGTWGGDWSGRNADGMHFQFARVR